MTDDIYHPHSGHQWSGDTRLPQPGEMVLCPVDGEEPVAGIVIGYFQAHGYLGIKLKVPERPANDDVICVFGAEVAVNPDAPKHCVAS